MLDHAYKAMAWLGERARERLSGLSSGFCEFVSDIASLRIEPDEELKRARAVRTSFLGDQARAGGLPAMHNFWWRSLKSGSYFRTTSATMKLDFGHFPQAVGGVGRL